MTEESLSEEQFACGMGEIIKHGLISMTEDSYMFTNA